MDDQRSLLSTPSHDAPDAFTAEPLLEVNQTEVMFLSPLPAAMRLTESVVYRPGLAVAMALLAGPVVCALAGAIVASVSGAIPMWLPLVMLLWLPALAFAWALLKSVRVTPDALACGRPLGQWRVIPLDEVERIEQRGLRMVVSAHSGPPLSFTPLLLHRGAQLRRSLLLRLPLQALGSALQAQAQLLSAGAEVVHTTGDVIGVLTVRNTRRWPTLLGGGAIALIGLAVVAWLAAAPSFSVALALALAAALGALCLWSVQEIFISEKGLIIHYGLLRHERDVVWARIVGVDYTPGEMTLHFRDAGGRRGDVSCAGPGLLSATDAQLMRQYINRYCPTEITPLLARRPR